MSTALPISPKRNTRATAGAHDRAQRNKVGHCPSVEGFESAYKREWMNEPWTDIERTENWLLKLEIKNQQEATCAL